MQKQKRHTFQLLNYVGLTQQLMKICRMVFLATLTRFNDRILKPNERTNCAEPDCQETYMGETKQVLTSRVQQHQRSGSGKL